MTQVPAPLAPRPIQGLETDPERPPTEPGDGKATQRESMPTEQVMLEQIPALIAEGRKRLAAFEANPTTWAALMHSRWATAALPLLLDALDLKTAQHAETLGYLERAYEVIEKDSNAYRRTLAVLWKSRRYWQTRDIAERPGK